ncbi:MAG: hypothetical protein ACJ741_06025 [Pyrinomonadaceae bacterium]
MKFKRPKRSLWVVRLVRWVRSKLDSFADLRDLLLIVAGGLYALGYAVWACNAYANNLGLLPAVDFQYFIAGITPALFLLVLSLTITGIFLFKQKLGDWLDPARRWGKYLRRFVVFVFFLSFLLFIVADNDTLKRAYPAQTGRVGVVAGLILIVTLILLPPRKRSTADLQPVRTARGATSELGKALATLRDDGFLVLMSFLGTVYAVGIALLLTWLGLYFFVVKLYPRLPQEFGGVRPRCAFLELKRAEVSDEIQEALLPQPAPSADTQTARSVQLDVHFSDSNLMLVKPHAQPGEFRSRTFEIKKEAVRAVVWCK